MTFPMTVLTLSGGCTLVLPVVPPFLNFPNVGEIQSKEEEIQTHEIHSAWEEFLKELEEQEGGGSKERVVYTPFSKSVEPEMQVRLESKIGAVSFHPTLKENGVTKTLIMGYIKDQNNVLLGSGSVEDLFHYGDGEEGMYALRFGIQKDSRDITAFALYEEVEKVGGTSKNEKIVILSHTERLPKK